MFFEYVLELYQVWICVCDDLCEVRMLDEPTEVLVLLLTERINCNDPKLVLRADNVMHLVLDFYSDANFSNRVP